ncbi:hypothetical protein SPLC1_S203730 [Arthrospira platensis C1]|nr:hypothetical protein SPLC1_S203730 [Arthrospira platensis C1]
MPESPIVNSPVWETRRYRRATGGGGGTGVEQPPPIG